jgi:hypothetical protein
VVQHSFSANVIFPILSTPLRVKRYFTPVWTSCLSSFPGECITVQGRDCEADEIPEIVARLHAVTSGCGTRELSLRRNAVGQLGFHVQPVSEFITSHKSLISEIQPLLTINRKCNSPILIQCFSHWCVHAGWIGDGSRASRASLAGKWRRQSKGICCPLLQLENVLKFHRYLISHF